MQPTPSLSERQTECLSLVSQGLTSKEIAQRLSISPHTVDQHIKTAIRVLNVSSRAAAVAEMYKLHPSPKSGSQPLGLAEPQKSAPFPVISEWPVHVERVGEAGSAVRETHLPFVSEHLALDVEDNGGSGKLSLWQKIIVIIVLAVMFPILMIGLTVFAKEAFHSPFG